MEKIAFISGSTLIYWRSIIVLLAAVTAVSIYAAVYLARGGSLTALSVSVPLAMALAIVLGRLIHWYSRTDAYPGFREAMTDYMTGNFALAGAFISCMLIACLLRLIRLAPNLPRMLDAMAVGGGAGIAVGRLSSLFNSSDRGMEVAESIGFPFAYPVINEVSGAVENRLATFMIQSVTTAVIVAALAIFLLVKAARKKEIRDGDICLMFLLTYGAVQIVCDSTRYDSLFLRSNGFISIVQILCLVAVFVPIVVFSVRMVLARGFRVWFPALWLATAGALGGAAYMEYYVQRHGGEAAFAYGVMSACMLCAVILTLIIRALGCRQTEKSE